MKELIQFPSELISFKTFATKQNVTVVFELQEALLPGDVAKLLYAKGKTGYLVFNPTTDERIKPEDVPNEPVSEAESKTPSQRLRAVLFVLYKSMIPHTTAISFDQFYHERMEKIIDHIKSKLPPQE